MKRKLIYAIVFTFLVTAIFTLSACGRGGQDNQRNNRQGRAEQLHYENIQTLTIAAPFNELATMQESAYNLQRVMANEGFDLQVNFIDYTPGERNSHFTLMLSKFAAGVGPDIFVRDDFPLYRFIENNFLADIYNVIDYSTNFIRDDFFTNVLEGIEVNGRLYMLPIQFALEYIGINANTPQSFIYRFAALDRASFSDITALYLDLISEYPEWAEFAFIHDINATQAFLPEFNHVIDFAERTVDLTARADLLENIQSAFYDNFRPTAFMNLNNAFDGLEIRQQRYVFSYLDSFNAIFGMFDYQEPFFVHYMPLAIESGQLVNRTRGIEMVVGNSANYDLAMEFMGQVISDRANHFFRFGIDIPILRQYFHQTLRAGFHNTLSLSQEMPPLVERKDFAIGQAIARMEEYSTWPSITSPLHSEQVIPRGIKTRALTLFLGRYDASINAVVHQMEAAVIHWMNQERPEIEKFVYVPEELPNLSVRTLTIRNPNNHTEIIRQAAAAMNADWQERDLPYIFQVEIEDHNWHNWQGKAARHTRLNTELMAGQGPDMIIFENHELHALAGSGFLRNIYDLMDACPNTSRDEFFTQALQAFEINNGLYMFPVSFGFEYVGINANIPQDFIDRFAQKSTISLMEMMEFYLDFKDAHGEEFSNLDLRTGSNVTFSSYVLQSIMGEFICFNTRTSNLTDPRFVEALELMYKVYADWDAELMWYTTLGIPDFLRTRARESLFYIQSMGKNNFDAFFTARPPIFKHHIPIAGSDGKLMLNHPFPCGSSQIWASILITAAGDGDLAWEFTRHLIHAYTYPIGRAALLPGSRSPANWGNNSLSTPILRSLFEDRTFNVFDHIHKHNAGQMQAFENMFTPSLRIPQFEAAVNRIATYNEMPMGMLSPMIPGFLYQDHFEQFRRGLITAKTAAQRIHNSVSLWVIE